MSDILELCGPLDLDSSDTENIKLLRRSKIKRKGRGFENNPKKKSYVCRNTDNDNQTPIASVEGWILFVTQIHEEATEDDLKEKFCETGNIKNIHLNLDRRTGFIKGYALIEYEGYEEAKNALDLLDGVEILGQNIEVNWCFVDKPPRADRRKNDKFVINK